MREAQLWYTPVPDQRTVSAEFENVIVLSDEQAIVLNRSLAIRRCQNP